MISLRAMTLHQAAEMVRDGELDLPEVAAALERAISAENPQLGAYTWLAPREPADGATAATALAGFGAAVKSNLCGAGWRNDCGSRILEHYRSPYDATAVARLRAAGAGFLGTTAMDEFGMGSSCEHCAWGPARNPWHAERTAGGSSGGSAAAVAAGLAWYALGTDTGGSVRYPAHCCGLVGLKPTWGRISRFGLIAFASSLDTVGVLARSVTDAALVGRTIAGHDPLDATSLTAEVGDWPRASRAAVTGLRVGVPEALISAHAGSAVAADFTRVLKLMEQAGAVIEDVEIPGLEDAVSIYTVIACAEASSNLARYDGGLYGERQSGDSYADMVARTRSLLGPEVKRRILLGTHVLSAGYREDLYLRACRVRRRLTDALGRIFDRVDLLALPTAAEAAFPLGSRLGDPVAMYETDLFTAPASLAGLPAVTLPTDLDRDGLPLSLQLVGPHLAEEKLLAMAGAVERAIDFRSRKEAPWQRSL